MQTDQFPSGYKLTEVGIIPSDWDVKKLGECFNIIAGIGFNKSEYVEHGVKLLRIDNVSHGKISWDSNAFLPLFYIETFHNFVIYENDILLALNRPITQGELKIALIKKEDTPCILYQRVGKIVFLDQSVNKIFAYYLLTKYIKQFVLENSVGSDQPFISTVQLKNNLLIPLPPIEEQKRIAQVLSDIDELIRSLDELIIKKRNIKQGTMQLLLTGKQRLPGYSGEWEVKKLGDLGNIVSGGTPKTSINSFWDGKIAWCTPTDITALKGSKYLRDTKRKITELGLINSSAQMLPINSVVMTTRATIGECAINKISVSTNQGFKSIVPNVAIDVEFLYYKLLMAKPDLITLGSGSTFFEVSKTDIVNYELFFPISKEEQKAIARILSDMDEEIEVLETKRDKYKDIKKGTMQELLTGKTRLV